MTGGRFLQREMPDEIYIYILVWVREGEREVSEELKLGYGHKKFHSILALK